jgi:hypothetical protein
LRYFNRSHSESTSRDAASETSVLAERAPMTNLLHRETGETQVDRKKKTLVLYARMLYSLVPGTVYSPCSFVFSVCCCCCVGFSLLFGWVFFTNLFSQLRQPDRLLHTHPLPNHRRNCGGWDAGPVPATAVPAPPPT